MELEQCFITNAVILVRNASDCFMEHLNFRPYCRKYLLISFNLVSFLWFQTGYILGRSPTRSEVFSGYWITSSEYQLSAVCFIYN